MLSKINLRIYLINGIIIISVIIVNIVVRSKSTVTIKQVDGEKIINITKQYGDYFTIISLISVAIIIFALVLSIIYLMKSHFKVQDRLNKLIEVFEHSNLKPIDIEKHQINKDDVMIVQTWNSLVNDLNDLNEKRDEYFKRMIHDFKSPIHIAKANIQLYRLTESNEYIDSVLEEINSLESEIERFLVIEKIEYFEKPNRENVNIIEVVEKIAIGYKQDDFNIKITNEASTNEYFIDRRMFKKVVENIIENAYKYSANPEVDITFYANRIEFSNKLQKEQNIGNIFDGQERLISTAGNGLGVSIIAKYGEMNNWEVYSKQKDNIFTVTLKLKNNN